MSLEPSPARQTGIVKYYNESRGYGFLRTERDGDVFFHISDARVAVIRNLLAIDIFNGYTAKVAMANFIIDEVAVKLRDRIYFYLDSTSNPKGPFASEWALADRWDRIAADYVEPKFVVFRHSAVRQRGEWQTQPIQRCFKGTLKELIDRYPSDHGCDSLAGFATDQAQQKFTFAVIADGKAKNCIDPRPRPRISTRV